MAHRFGSIARYTFRKSVWLGVALLFGAMLPFEALRWVFWVGAVSWLIGITGSELHVWDNDPESLDDSMSAVQLIGALGLYFSTLFVLLIPTDLLRRPRYSDYDLVLELLYLAAGLGFILSPIGIWLVQRTLCNYYWVAAKLEKHVGGSSLWFPLLGLNYQELGDRRQALKQFRADRKAERQFEYEQRRQAIAAHNQWRRENPEAAAREDRQAELAAVLAVTWLMNRRAAATR